MKSPPMAGPPRPFHLPEIVSGTLSSGLAVKSIHRSGSPLVSAELVLDAGEAGVNLERAGLAVVSASALDGGTRRRSGAELASALERLGSSVSASAGWDETTVSFSALPDRFAAVMELVAESIREPAFPEDEVERVRNQRLASIEQRRSIPSSLADDAIAAEIFAAMSRDSCRLSGTRRSVSAFTASDLARFADERYVPGRGGLCVAGPLAASEVTAIADRSFGGWTGEPPGRARGPSEARYGGAGVLIVDRPGSVQAELRIGHLGIARSSPDYFPLRVFNAVLGGTFTSRLNLNLRERNGFTYGVRSAFRTRRARGPFVVSTGVGTDVAVAAVRECLAEIDTILADGPTEAEVAAVKDYLIGVFPLTMETTSQLAGQMGNLVTHDLPDDYYARWRDEMAAVGATEAREAGRRCLRPGDLRIVVVGDAAALRGGLEELGVGPVETVDPVALEEEAS